MFWPLQPDRLVGGLNGDRSVKTEYPDITTHWRRESARDHSLGASESNELPMVNTLGRRAHPDDISSDPTSSDCLAEYNLGVGDVKIEFRGWIKCRKPSP